MAAREPITDATINAIFLRVTNDQSLLNALERAQLEHLDSITPTEFAALSDDAKTSMFLLCNPMLFPRHLYIDEPAAELPSSDIHVPKIDDVIRRALALMPGDSVQLDQLLFALCAA